MEWTYVVTAGIGMLFLIISFFIKDRSKQNEEELQDLSMNLYQELYQLKKRTKLLEEELMIENSRPVKTAVKKSKPVNEIIVNQVLSLHKQGLKAEQISNLSSLPVSEVKTLIKNRS
ncbi:hypothetical protein [Jeotgalibacillus aurantiacus]|uniref:hypothetical protein n=1 Tax=Jeotgalibacillus aurantiacus TaxID=2763266 RepID=UPI001D0A3974|nr:hypothetical protein [Jeotgalibacillus aurantiacus]